MREAIQSDCPPYALLRGPVVYAYDTAWQSATKPVSPDRLAFDPDDPAPLHQVDAPGRALGPGLVTHLKSADRENVEVLMLPFANIGRYYRTQAEMRTARNTDTYPYAVWLTDANHRPTGIDRMESDDQGFIKPGRISREEER